MAWRGQVREHTLFLSAKEIFDENTAAKSWGWGLEERGRGAAVILWLHFQHCLINISAHTDCPEGKHLDVFLMRPDHWLFSAAPRGAVGVLV